MVMSPGYSRPSAGERLRRAGVAAWSIIGILVLSAIFVWAFLKVRIVFPPLVLAILILFVLNPLVTRLERWRVPRAAAALASYVVVLGGLALAVLALIPILSQQVRELSDRLPEFRDQAIAFTDENVARLEETLNTEIDTTQISCLLGSPGNSLTEVPSPARCDEVTQDLRNQIVAHAGRITDIGSSIIEVLVIFVIGPLIALYLLIDLPHLSRDLKNVIPPSHRDEFVDLGGKVSHAIGGFFRGQLLVALIVGFLSALGFYFIGLPFWFVIGGIAGFFNLVPLIGPYIGGALGFLVGIVSGGGLSLGLRAALVELIVQQVDNHFISPNVMRRTVNLHPVTVILALLAGGALAGFWGVLLGVPAVAVMKVLLSHLWSTRVLGAEVTPHSGRRAETSATPPEGGPGARDGPGSREEELEPRS